MKIAIDIETYEQKKGHLVPQFNQTNFTIGCLSTDTGIKKHFTTREDMRNYLKKTILLNKAKKENTTIYAHKMEGDYYNLFHQDILNPQVEYVVFRPWISTYAKNATFTDSSSIYPMTIQELGEAIGLPKLPMDTNIHAMEQHRTNV